MVRTPEIKEAWFDFSYFDPDAGQYKTVQSAKQPLQVTGDEMPAEVAPNESTPVPEEPKPPSDALAAWHTKHSPVSSLSALIDRPVMLSWLIAAAIAALLGPLGAALKWYLLQPQRLAARALINETKSALLQVHQCEKKNDLLGFIAAARSALQIQLAALWQKPAHSITLSELSQRLPSDSPVNQFFREADKHIYSEVSQVSISTGIRALFQQALSALQSSQ